MKAKFAELVSKRYALSTQEDYNSDSRRLAQDIFPNIANAAFKGHSEVMIMPPINDALALKLRSMGYVVKQHVSVGYSTVDWGEQNVIEVDGRTRKISSTEYNDYMIAKDLHEQVERGEQASLMDMEC